MKSTLKIETISIKECLKNLGMTEATANIFVLPKVIRKPLNKP
jgi:hypothetical protein